MKNLNAILFVGLLSGASSFSCDWKVTTTADGETTSVPFIPVNGSMALPKSRTLDYECTALVQPNLQSTLSCYYPNSKAKGRVRVSSVGNESIPIVTVIQNSLTNVGVITLICK